MEPASSPHPPAPWKQLRSHGLPSRLQGQIALWSPLRHQPICRQLMGDPQKDMFTSGTSECDLLGKRSSQIKSFKMKSPWITQMAPTSCDKCPYKRQKTRHRGKDHMKSEAEIGGMQPQAKECQEPPETGRGRKDPPRSLRREQALPTP